MPVITSLLQGGKQRQGEAGQREKPFQTLGVARKCPPSPSARERWAPSGATGQELPEASAISMPRLERVCVVLTDERPCRGWGALFAEWLKDPFVWGLKTKVWGGQ